MATRESETTTKKAATKKAATKKAATKKAATKKAATKKAATKKAATKKAATKKAATKKAATKPPRRGAPRPEPPLTHRAPVRGHRERATVGTATVLGGGSWGTALAHILGTHGYETVLWMRDEERVAEINATHRNRRYLKDHPIDERVVASSDLQLAATHAPCIVCAIPSKAIRSVAYELGHHTRGDQILISATKGLEIDALTRMSEVLRQETCVRKVGALSGPNLAAEVIAGQPSATVIASLFDEVVEVAERMFAGPRFRVYGNHDIVGVELAGALKNVVAIAAGVAAGLGFGANTLSMLVTRGLAEISRLGEVLGARALTFQGLAGIGDLIATCSSSLSRNHTVGRRLAGGERLDDIIGNLGMVAEGVNTTRGLHLHADRLGVDMPIAEGMYRLMFDELPPLEVLDGLMARRSVFEGSDDAIHETLLHTRSVVEHAAAAELRASSAGPRPR